MRIRTQFLSRAEEKRLAIRARAGDTEARNRIVLGMLPFIRLLAGRVAERFGGDIEDMMSAALVRILEKFNSYDPHRGYRASTYFGRAALHAMRDYATHREKVIRTPKNDYEPTNAAAYRARHCTRSLSDILTYDPEPLLISDTIPDARAVPADEIASRADQAAFVRQCLDRLPRKQRDVLQGRLDGRKLHEIGEDIGLTRERVRQIEEEGKAALAVLLRGA